MFSTFVRTLTRYENTVKSALYTNEVDFCILGAIITKVSFPWVYEYMTGNNCK